MSECHARHVVRRRMYGLVSLALIVLFGLSACGNDDKSSSGSATATPPDQASATNPDWKLGLVTNVGGTVSDGGFSESAHKGALRAVDVFQLDYAYAISKDENDYAIQLDRQIADGRNIIVTVGYPMEAITLEYARAHPDVYFIGVDHSYAGEEIPPNLIGLSFAEDEAAFIVGALAGLMTQSDVVAVIGGIEIPPVVRLAEGFRNGAQYVNPDVQVLITYTGAFDDAALGTSTATDFIAHKADVIFGAAGSTGYAGIQYAARQGVWVVGVDQDEWRTNFREGSIEGSERILTSAIKRVDNGVYQAVASIIDGQPISGVAVLRTQDCGVGYAPFHQASDQIPAQAQTTLEAIWRALAAGTLSTGVGEGAVAPDPLKAGTLPAVPADAPYPADCEA